MQLIQLHLGLYKQVCIHVAEIVKATSFTNVFSPQLHHHHHSRLVVLLKAQLYFLLPGYLHHQ